MTETILELASRLQAEERPAEWSAAREFASAAAAVRAELQRLRDRLPETNAARSASSSRDAARQLAERQPPGVLPAPPPAARSPERAPIGTFAESSAVIFVEHSRQKEIPRRLGQDQSSGSEAPILTAAQLARPPRAELTMKESSVPAAELPLELPRRPREEPSRDPARSVFPAAPPLFAAEAPSAQATGRDELAPIADRLQQLRVATAASQQAALDALDRIVPVLEEETRRYRALASRVDAIYRAFAQAQG